MAESKMKEFAKARGQTESQMLRDLFREHIFVSAVAKAIGVSPSTIDMALLRTGLIPRWSCDLVPRRFDWQNDEKQ